MAASLSTLKEKASLLTVTLVALFVIVFAGQRGVGYTVRVASHRPLYSFIATLPPDSVIAGWPLGIMDNVPYLGRRNAFLTYETHQVLHMEYMQEMRKRMTALIDAYLGQDIQPLLDLNKRFGVDYLLVDKRHFAKGSSLNPPWYVAPFREQILSLVAQTQGNAFVISNRVDPAAIFWGGDIPSARPSFAGSVKDFSLSTNRLRCWTGRLLSLFQGPLERRLASQHMNHFGYSKVGRSAKRMPNRLLRRQAMRRISSGGLLR